MKKKIVLLSTLFAVAIGSTLATVLVTRKSASQSVVTRASEKEFTFNESVAQAQFPSSSNDEVEKSVVTGVGDNLETKVSLIESDEDEGNKAFGDKGYFVRNGATIIRPTFNVIIGVNNLTSISVVFGCVKTEYTSLTSFHCRYNVLSKEHGNYTTVSSTSTDMFNVDRTLEWVKQGSGYNDTITEVVISVGYDGGTSSFWGEPLYIKSITLTWVC